MTFAICSSETVGCPLAGPATPATTSISAQRASITLSPYDSSRHVETCRDRSRPAVIWRGGRSLTGPFYQLDTAPARTHCPAEVLFVNLPAPWPWRLGRIRFEQRPGDKPNQAAARLASSRYTRN